MGVKEARLRVMIKRSEEQDLIDDVIMSDLRIGL